MSTAGFARTFAAPDRDHARMASRTVHVTRPGYIPVVNDQRFSAPSALPSADWTALEIAAS
jgi:hypothetical protein